MTTLQAATEGSMKKVLIIVAGVLVAMAAGAYKNEQNGFRGHEWGSPLPEGWGKPQYHDDSYGGMDIYRESGQPPIGCAALAGVSYKFWHSKLTSIEVRVQGYPKFSCLHDALVEKFGEAHEADDQRPGALGWVGTKTIMLIWYDETDYSGHLLMISTELLKQQDAWKKEQDNKEQARRKEQAKKGASQF